VEPSAFSDYSLTVVTHGAVKITMILTGLACVYMGYKLFSLGVLSGGASFKFEGWSTKVALGKAAPGALFALFGAGIVTAAILHRGEVSSETKLVTK
jgi:hypothetical protein